MLRVARYLRAIRGRQRDQLGAGCCGNGAGLGARHRTGYGCRRGLGGSTSRLNAVHAVGALASQKGQVLVPVVS